MVHIPIISSETQQQDVHRGLYCVLVISTVTSHFTYKLELHFRLVVELPFCEPGNVWSSKVFLLIHIDYVSLNSNP